MDHCQVEYGQQANYTFTNLSDDALVALAKDEKNSAFAELCERHSSRIFRTVFRIARNACLMQRRKSVFAPSRELAIDEVSEISEPSDGTELPDEALLHSELRNVVDRIILELPPAYRAVA